MSGGEERPAASFGPRQAQPLDDFLSRVSSMSLDSMLGRLDGAAGVSRDLAAERAQIAALAARLLSPDMRPLLEWLCDMTLRRPIFLFGLREDALAWAASREGENRVVWQLLLAIAEGRAEAPPPREGV